MCPNICKNYVYIDVKYLEKIFKKIETQRKTNNYLLK